MTVKIEPAPDLDDCVFLARHLRKMDRLELTACRPYNDTWAIASDLFSWRGKHALMAYNNGGEPVAAFGALVRWPGVVSVYCLATSRWNEVVLSVTRYAKNTLVPELFEEGAHRLEALVIDGYPDTDKWIGPRCLGATLESTMPQYGKNGETFHKYVRLKES